MKSEGSRIFGKRLPSYGIFRRVLGKGFRSGKRVVLRGRDWTSHKEHKTRTPVVNESSSFRLQLLVLRMKARLSAFFSNDLIHLHTKRIIFYSFFP